MGLFQELGFRIQNRIDWVIKLPAFYPAPLEQAGRQAGGGGNPLVTQRCSSDSQTNADASSSTQTGVSPTATFTDPGRRSSTHWYSHICTHATEGVSDANAAQAVAVHCEG